ncbi:MAG: carbamoyltransferase HypF, partial [Chloroflexi bacterium]|nr:carbamoyltransferase HypF [Chloroflexota bacterium]
MVRTPATKSMEMVVKGVVQGVGFRPFVYRLALRYGLAGWVRNTSSGVEIDVEGDAVSVDSFVTALAVEAPAQAKIEEIVTKETGLRGYGGFFVRESREEEGRYQLISPDIATCGECLKEVFSPADRRYRYPFTNCTNCGPRFTIIEDIPYDRQKTTMRHFEMCADCRREYDDPLDRRFHAQPNACPKCGPSLELVNRDGSRIVCTDPVREAARLLGKGSIVAIKGLGGFLLACDATNPVAVETLRQRKRRPSKPLAVMVGCLEEIRQHCFASVEEERLLASPQSPIVLLRWKDGSSVCPEVAPGVRYLGVMLPYTPLHHLLLAETSAPLVMTSGNLSEEPIAGDNAEALARLGSIADYFLLHDRDIYALYDDSVFVVQNGIGQAVRRARGFAPYPVALPFSVKQVLACGAEDKNTLCLTRDKYAFVSQHIGDMENEETLEH